MANAPRNNGLLESPTMASTELIIANDSGGSGGRGLQSWQMIDTNWSKLYFQENGGPTCTATIPGPLPKFYPKGGNAAPPATASTPANLAYDLQLAMNAASCTGAKANTYSVSYDGTTGRFSFWAAGPKTFRLGTGAQQINGALGSLDTATWATASVAGGSVTLVFTTASTPRLTAIQKGTNANGGTRITTNAAHGVVVGDTCSITGAAPATINTVAVAVTAVTATVITMNPLASASGATVPATTLGTVTCTHTTAAVAGTSVRSTTPYTLLYRPVSTASNNPQFGAGGYFSMPYKNNEIVGSTSTTIYTARAQRFFNGEVIRVQSDGQICGMTFPTAAERTNPPSFTVQQVNPGCGTDVANATATFRWGGAYYVDQASGSYCNGMVNRVQLVPCDLRSPAPTQLTTIAPWLANEFPLDATGMPDPAPIDLLTKTATTGYTEAQDGTWNTLTYPPFMAGGVKGYGSTPIAASIQDIDTLFTNLWTTGQAGAAVMAGPPPYQISAISTHTNPKEKTILLFVTDGADTCAGSGDPAGLTAANAAKNLYLPVVNCCKDAWRQHDLDPALRGRQQQRRLRLQRARLVGADLHDRLRRRRQQRGRRQPPELDLVGRQRGQQGLPRPGHGEQHHDQHQPEGVPRPVLDLPRRVHRPRRGHAPHAAAGDHQPGRAGRRLQRAAVGDRHGLRVREPGGVPPSTTPATSS